MLFTCYSGQWIVCPYTKIVGPHHNKACDNPCVNWWLGGYNYGIGIVDCNAIHCADCSKLVGRQFTNVCTVTSSIFFELWSVVTACRFFY